MQSVTYQRERVHDLWAEIAPLLDEHYREISAFQDIPLAPDRPRYEAAENAGTLRCYTARWDGRLVGYIVFFVSSHAHYCTSMQAAQDVVFVAAPYRRGRLGMDLLRFADTALAAEGVAFAYQHVKVKHPALRKVLEYFGYELTEWVMVKRLKKAA